MMTLSTPQTFTANGAMGKIALALSLAVLATMSFKASALAMAPEEFKASRQLACILAQQSLGQLSEDEYGEMTHDLLDEFEDLEQDNILSKALGYYDGLMFSIESDDSVQVEYRLEKFVNSPTCSSDYRKVTYTL